MKILQIDSNHPILKEMLIDAGFSVDEDTHSSYADLKAKLKDYSGVIIRSRVPMDEEMLRSNPQLKFIGRVGAGLENIDLQTAEELGIRVYHSPEGNRDAVAEHTLAMLLALTNRLIIASKEVQLGIWKREENRGYELFGKTFGIIGYGHMGKAVARRLQGFGMDVIFHDILPDLENGHARQVSVAELQAQADIISLHVPLTPETHHLIDEGFIRNMKKNFYLINTARGGNVKLSAVRDGISSGKILGAGLDVLEIEKSSFETIENEDEDFQFLLASEKCLITPHIAGWTQESKVKLATTIAEKIITDFKPKA